MIKLASVALAATLGLSALGLTKPAAAGVVVGVGLPVPAVTIFAGIPLATPAPTIYPHAFVRGAYYPPWRYRYPYYLGYRYRYRWHRGYGWPSPVWLARPYVRGPVARGWQR